MICLQGLFDPLLMTSHDGSTENEGHFCEPDHHLLIG